MRASSTPIGSEISGILSPFTGRDIANMIVEKGVREASVSPTSLSRGDRKRLLEKLEGTVDRWVRSGVDRIRCREALRGVLAEETTAQAGIIHIKKEAQIVEARAAVKAACDLLGFRQTDQMKIATIVSELARNIYQYAGGGTISFSATPGDNPTIEITARDEGPGIPNIDEIMAGNYRSKTGMGMGLRAAQRIMDKFEIVTGSTGGTTVRIQKKLRGRA